MLIKPCARSIIAVLGLAFGSFGSAYAHVPTACVKNPGLCYKTETEFAGHALPTERAQYRESDKSGVILFAPIGDGKYIISEVTYRKKGTRAPIHVHPFGGQTCVVWGQMTLWLEDVERKTTSTTTKKTGECYWMPPNQRMSGVNDGATAAVMLDLFIVEGSELDPTRPDFPALLVEKGFIVQCPENGAKKNAPCPKVDTEVKKLDLNALVEEAKKDTSSGGTKVLADHF